MLVLRQFLGLAALSFLSFSALASNIRVLPVTHADGKPAPSEIYLSGEIAASTVTELAKVIRDGHLESAILYLDSAGGDPQAGIDLGELIRRSNINTAVGRVGTSAGRPQPANCQSACVLAFVGGKYRFIDPMSRLGIHRFYRKTALATDLDVAQVMSAAITGYLIRMNIDPALFERMVQVGRGRMEVLSQRDAAALNVVNNGVLPAEWSIEGKSGSVYLRGIQETWNGTGKVVMTCAPGRQVKFSALYDAGENTPLIARETANYSLRVNQQFIPVSEMQARATISGGYLTASFVPTANMLWSITAAEQLGFGFHTRQVDTFYGFLVDARGAQDMIRSWVKHCTER